MRLIAILVAVLAVCPAALAGSDIELVSYGDLAWRDTGLASPMNYSAWAARSETRLIFGKSEDAMKLRPYLKTNVAYTSENVTTDNTFEAGLGVEVRPFAGNWSKPRDLVGDLLGRMRFFAEYSERSYLRDSLYDPPNPRENFVVGFDLYREFGAVDQSDPDTRRQVRHWAEFYLGSAYETTDFIVDHYQSLRTNASLKGGTGLGRGTTLMPYVLLDSTISSNSHLYWDNRLITGLGVRFDVNTGPSSKLKLYAEHIMSTKYFKEEPPVADEVPKTDLRVGVQYQYNRY